MKNICKVLIPLLLILICAQLGIAQTQTARILVKGVTPDLMAQGRYDAVSSGLPNIGKGQKVWLEALALFSPETTAANSWIDTILTKTWSIIGPPGSLVTGPVETDTTTYFIPDTTGQYQVNLTVTTSHGTVDASIYINSAHWMGVGNIAGTPGMGQCGLGCHTQKVSDWQKTGHSKIFSYNVDNSDHYSENCVSCHTVGYDKLATAVNGGWDDVAGAYGFTIPTPQYPGVWDSIKTNFPLLANVSNIQCENCHGPGSLHNEGGVGLHDKNQVSVSLSADMCGQCHSGGAYHVKNTEWNNSRHSKSMAEEIEIEHMNSRSCARCHTGNGYVNETIKGNSQSAPYDNAQSVTCAACHDPHDNSNPGQLRTASVGTACDGCHIVRISSRSGLHHSNQSPMLYGSKGTPYSGQSGSIGNWSGWQFPGYQYPNSSHSDIEGRCAECHMATVSGDNPADTAMVPAPYSEWKGKLGGHTFKVAWDRGTPDDESDDLLNPFGCVECHGTVSREFVDMTKEKTKALLEELRVLLPHNTSGDTTLPLPPANATLSPIQKAASYNWYFVNSDGSYGVHNYQYASALLRSSIEMVKLGAGAAGISSIVDVPNDQGKQVQIIWNKFPAESYPTEPVVSYLVLRQDSSGSLGKGSIAIAESYRDMLEKFVSNSRVNLSGSVWTKVGEYKAIDQPTYSIVVPTLYDSTIVDGMKQTTFEIVGYTAGKTVYTSLPVSGYSIDNLSPAAPIIAVQSGGGLAKLTWNESQDEDFKYFAVYRGLSPDFVPGETPIGTTTSPEYADGEVSVGVTYYYKVSSFDFSGNESNYSNEVEVLVTSVDNDLGLPKEFTLHQNHPNPFNPSTSIRYELPAAVHVTISVYNTLGMLVATIINDEQEAGYHSVVWDGTDLTGNSVASGIYLYKMDAGGRSFAKKMMFIK